jgi:hypothetical protein
VRRAGWGPQKGVATRLSVHHTCPPHSGGDSVTCPARRLDYVSYSKPRGRTPAASPEDMRALLTQLRAAQTAQLTAEVQVGGWA